MEGIGSFPFDKPQIPYIWIVNMKTATDLFLDAVDSVLNSNTFLLKIERGTEMLSDQEAIHQALFSKEFDQALYKADLNREWEIFHDSDVQGDELVYTPIPFNKGQELGLERQDTSFFPNLLLGMLIAGDPSGFHSPYDKAKSPKEAKALLNNFLAELKLGSDTSYYKLDKSCLFLPFDPKTELVYWDNTPSDTLSAMLDADWIYFLLTNGAG